MYGAMRERARYSTKITGLSAAALMTCLGIYVLSTGFVVDIAKMIEIPITFTPVVEEVLPERPEQKADAFDASKAGLSIPTPLVQTEIFEVEEGKRITGSDDDGTGKGGDGTGVAPVPPKAVRTRPVLLTRSPPPYPLPDIRKQNEGVTTLEVCIAASGRVTSATITNSSGHPTLDDAALKWMRNGRFTPAKVNGAAEAVCGHNVDYEWNLEIIRK